MNSTLEHRLKRWSELQPQCRALPLSSGYALRFGDVEVDILPSDPSDRTQILNLSYALRAALEAANTPETALRLRLENDGNSLWHATLLDLACQTVSTGTNPEPALATLEAYVGWLEAGCEVEAAGGES